MLPYVPAHAITFPSIRRRRSNYDPSAILNNQRLQFAITFPKFISILVYQIQAIQICGDL